MILKLARVTNFRSAEDSGEFAIDRVTCLVGKNEAGKSAILMALASLNPHSATPMSLDRERDYPRRSLIQYEERHGGNEAVAISTVWELNAAESEAIQDRFGHRILSENRITFSRRYGSSAVEISAPIDYEAGLSFLYTKFALDAPDRAALKSAQNSSDLMRLLEKLEKKSEKQAQLQAHLSKHGNIRAQVESQLLSLLPKFMYFSSYDRMDGAIQVEHVRELLANGQISKEPFRGARLFVDFLNYAGVSIEDIAKAQTFETFNAKLKGASNNITDQVLEYWTQNPDLSVEIAVQQGKPGDVAPFNSGTVVRARIDNALHRVDTPFSERSAGFVWFFSFLVKFAQVKSDDVPVVLLLDEPGLTLHGKAQADLLRFFNEKLAPHHQIIFSTHSPFMVPANRLDSVRIVEDQIELSGSRRKPIGTKVRSDVLSRDPDTVFPLQGALGYEITQSLFIGKHTLLVEGPGDILYLQALSAALRRRGRAGLDARWTLCPAGGIDKISAFVALFAGNDLHVAALSDQSKSDRKKVEQLRRSEVLRAGHVFTIADFLNRDEADIEDLFSPKLFATLLNGAYSLLGGHIMDETRLATAASGTTRLVKQSEAAFNLLPQSIALFDHFTPASWLIVHPDVLDGGDAEVIETLERAEAVFDALNRLLP